MPRVRYSYDLIQLYFSAAVKMNEVIVLYNEEEKLSAMYPTGYHRVMAKGVKAKILSLVNGQDQI